MTLKHSIYRHLSAGPTTLGHRLVQHGIMGIIVLNVAGLIVGTVHTSTPSGPVPLEVQHPEFFYRLNLYSLLLFTLEYVLRVWTCTENPRFARPILGRLRFIVTPMAIVDLVAILPFYLQHWHLIAVRSLRLFRVFRILKLGYYSTALKSLSEALYHKRAELVLLIFTVGIILVLSSTVMYHAENHAQPDKFSSIPATMWWSIITLTTVGYGDMCPITPLGKIVGAIVALFGVAIVAVPAGIVGSAFVQQIRREEASRKCPHCGKHG
jgi:voltage-gated potassium channel